MSVALPSKLLFQSKIESAAARSYRSNIQPQNGTGIYKENDTIMINIPTRNNLVSCFPESYLKFNVAITSLAANNYIRLDSGGAHGFIQRIRVFSGSNLLSDIDNYGLLVKMMMDLQQSPDACFGKNTILCGTRSDLTYKTLAAADQIGSVYQTNSGYRFQTEANKLTNTLAAHAANEVVNQTFSLNLVSLVGTLCAEKYFPLFACTSAPIRVEIQLVSNCSAAVCSQTPCTFAISNCEYVAQLIELSDAAMSTILNQTNGQPLQFCISDYKNFASSQLSTSIASSTLMSVPIAAKYSSLKSLFVAMRDSSKISTLTYFPHSTHKFCLNEYFFRIGSQIVPSKSPSNIPEFFSEVLKAVGSMSDMNLTPSIDLLSFSQDFPIANNDLPLFPGSNSSGSFYIGLDLENYSGADRSTIFSGWNSNTDDIYLNCNFNPSVGPANYGAVATIIRFDTYALFDSVVVFENNTCYVKF